MMQPKPQGLDLVSTLFINHLGIQNRPRIFAADSSASAFEFSEHTKHSKQLTVPSQLEGPQHLNLA